MNRMDFIRGSMAAMGATAVAASASPARAEAAKPSRFDTATSRGKLLVSTMTTIPPLAFKDDTGALTGFDIAIGHLAAKSMFGDDSKVEFVPVSADGRFPSVVTGQADYGQATIYMSRANIVAFTEPYIDTSITLLVSKRSGLKTLDDVNKSGVTVANLNNPQMAERAKQFFPNASVSIFDGFSSQFLAVRSGRAQAMQVDSVTADFYAAQNKGELEVLNARLGDVFGNGLYAAPDDFRWTHWLNTFVRELKTGSLYSDYSQAFQKWFGKNPPPQRFY